MGIDTFYKEEKMMLDSKTLIKKSVEVAKKPMQLIQLSKGLNVRQQRFFNLAILKVENGLSEISVNSYREVFADDTDNFYSAAVITDIEKLVSLNIQTTTDEKIRWENVFLFVEYDKNRSVYIFGWSPFMKARIENVRKNYIQQDLKTLAKFNNKYSFIWYDHFKSSYKQWKWKFTREEVVDLLQVGNIKSYREKHSVFFKQCITGPLEELNTYTEYAITVTPIKKGRIVTGYEFTRATKKGTETSVTSRQIDTLKEIIERYGDTPLIMREISLLGVYNGQAAKELIDLYFEIQKYKRLISAAEEGVYSSEMFKDIIALAIKKDNEFKFLFNSVRKVMENKSISDTSFEKKPIDKPKSGFYNWIDERE